MILHKRQPYLRPRFMGGDVAHPLCVATLVGWAGPKLARLPMTDMAARVSCPACLRYMAAGGIAARRADLDRMLSCETVRGASRRAA